MKEKIEDLLSNVLMELFSIDMSSLPHEARDYPLLSEKFGIEPYQMITFMESVEEKFGIKIPEQAIVEQRFNSFNSIVEIINLEENKI